MDNAKMIVEKIKTRYKSIRKFAATINVPYSTILSGLKVGIGGMAVETVIKMAAALDMTVNELINAEPLNPKKAQQEQLLFETYVRAKESDKVAVKALVRAIDKLLNINERGDDE